MICGAATIGSGPVLLCCALRKRRVKYRVPEKCNDQNAAAAQAGDRYYKVIGEWLRGRMKSPVLRQQARRLASTYRRSLDLVIDCYRRVRGSVTAKRELRHARELQALLNRDMEILGPSTGELPPTQTQPEQ